MSEEAKQSSGFNGIADSILKFAGDAPWWIRSLIYPLFVIALFVFIQNKALGKIMVSWIIKTVELTKEDLKDAGFFDQINELKQQIIDLFKNINDDPKLKWGWKYANWIWLITWLILAFLGLFLFLPLLVLAILIFLLPVLPFGFIFSILPEKKFSGWVHFGQIITRLFYGLLILLLARFWIESWTIWSVMVIFGLAVLLVGFFFIRKKSYLLPAVKIYCLLAGIAGLAWAFDKVYDAQDNNGKPRFPNLVHFTDGKDALLESSATRFAAKMGLKRAESNDQTKTDGVLTEAKQNRPYRKIVGQAPFWNTLVVNNLTAPGAPDSILFADKTPLVIAFLRDSLRDKDGEHYTRIRLPFNPNPMKTGFVETRNLRSVTEEEIDSYLQKQNVQSISKIKTNPFLYNPDKGLQVLATVNKGDVITIKPTITEQIFWQSEGKWGNITSFAEASKERSARAQLIYQADQFIDPSKPPGLFMVCLPVDGWLAVTEGGETFTIKAPGKIIGSINTQNGYFNLCQGIVIIEMSLDT